MKYYAVTDDPRELYHYGVKGMKWGQHIFGDKPKSPGYHRALKKLRTNVQKASSATAKTVSKVAKAAKKTATQIGYDVRAKQQNRFEKSVAKAQAKLDKSNIKFDNYQIDTARKAIEKKANKAIKVLKRQDNAIKRKENFNNAVSAVQKTANQIAQTKRDMEQRRYNKAVEKAQKRNKLSDALRGLDQENKLYKQADRERKMDALREKQADVMANNDLKSLQKAVRVEKNMPKYYQEARTGMLSYGKLSDEQIGRLQNRLALEANTRRLGSTEAPSWHQQKKAARRQGYLQGITKGIAAGMEEVGKASVQYGIQNYMNRKKMDNASEQKAQREKVANRIKSKKTHHEIDQDIKQEAYEARVREGENVVRRNLPTLSTARQAKRLQAIDNAKRERQNAINDANDERKFLMEEKHNAARSERQRQERLAEVSKDMDSAGKALYENGYAIVPSFNKDGKKTGYKILTADGGGKDKNGNDLNEGRAYLTLYKSKNGLTDKRSNNLTPEERYLKTISEGVTVHTPTKEEIKQEASQRSKEFFKDHDAQLAKERVAHERTEQRRKSLALAKEMNKALKEFDKANKLNAGGHETRTSNQPPIKRLSVQDVQDFWYVDPKTGEVKPRKKKGSKSG